VFKRGIHIFFLKKKSNSLDAFKGMASSLRRNAGRNVSTDMNMGGGGEFLSMSRFASPPRSPPLRRRAGR